MVKLEKENESA